MKWLLWAGLGVAGAPAGAQPAPSGRARVYSVVEGDFAVPQVKLPDAAVARRINRALLRLIIADRAEGVDSLGTPQQQLRQAARASRYDAGAQALRSAAQGFVGADYETLLNQDFLLSLGFGLEFVGAYPSRETKHATFDLRTGRRLRLGDLIADPPAQLTRRLQGAINRRMGEKLAEIAADSNDPAEVADLTERFHWNRTTRRVNFETDGHAGGAVVVLDDFALTPPALLLFYQVGLPHAILNFEPDDTYRFPYARVLPRGPLVPLAKTTAPAPKP
ncbi:MAG: hypothetical protein ACRYFR_15685 [Janthinobacterium lividum]